MKKLALVPLLVIPTVVAFALMAGLVSGGAPAQEFSIQVAVNVYDDPGEHAQFIEMPDNIKLTVLLAAGGTLDVTGPSPWVSVTDSSFSTDLGGSVVHARGFGTVAGFENILVAFTGTFDPEHPDGPTFTGFYEMGVPGFVDINTLPGGEPIVYRIKRKPDAPGASTATATVSGLGAPTDTPAPGQPTATVPGLGAPTSTPVPYDLSIVVKIDADSGVVMEGWEMNVFQGDGCTGSPILSGPTEFLGYEFGLGYAVFLPPGDYSVSETQQPGWERVDGTPFCQNFIPGDTPTFFNRMIHDGDLNEDGVTNSLDVLLVLQTIAGLLPEPPNYIRADVNYDGTVNAVDSALMLQFDAGFLDSLPVGSAPTPATPTATPTPTPTATPSPTSLAPLTPPPADRHRHQQTTRAP